MTSKTLKTMTRKALLIKEKIRINKKIDSDIMNYRITKEEKPARLKMNNPADIENIGYSHKMFTDIRELENDYNEKKIQMAKDRIELNKLRAEKAGRDFKTIRKTIDDRQYKREFEALIIGDESGTKRFNSKVKLEQYELFVEKGIIIDVNKTDRSGKEKHYSYNRVNSNLKNCVCKDNIDLYKTIKKQIGQDILQQAYCDLITGVKLTIKEKGKPLIEALSYEPSAIINSMKRYVYSHRKQGGKGGLTKKTNKDGKIIYKVTKIKNLEQITDLPSSTSIESKVLKDITMNEKLYSLNDGYKNTKELINWIESKITFNQVQIEIERYNEKKNEYYTEKRYIRPQSLLNIYNQ
jgi:hypothetical protein